MINPEVFLITIIDPSCRMLTAAVQRNMATNEALVLMLAIGLQESELEHRIQIGTSGQYARGFWQFEAGGGVHGVCTHPASSEAAKGVCAMLRIPWGNADIHEAIAFNDPLAAAYARLLLYTDPAPLPEVGDEEGSWNNYYRLWRPGKPHPEMWPKNYQLAVDTVMGNATEH